MQLVRKLIVGNWKMNGTLPEAQSLIRQITADKPWPKNTDNPPLVVLCPSHPMIHPVAMMLDGYDWLTIGAQDCYTQDIGAFTGDVSAMILQSLGVKYCIVGHSERRRLHNENNQLIAQKIICCQKRQITPILCIGETIDERNKGATSAVLEQQLQESLNFEVTNVVSSLVVAYEPVWAIGTGKIPSKQEIIFAHQHIRKIIMQHHLYRRITPVILYGGSVKPDNAAEIVCGDGVDGLLVGGASLKASDFRNIIAACIQ
jgi:triosephosphate isomerase